MTTVYANSNQIGIGESCKAKLEPSATSTLLCFDSKSGEWQDMYAFERPNSCYDRITNNDGSVCFTGDAKKVAERVSNGEFSFSESYYVYLKSPQVLDDGETLTLTMDDSQMFYSAKATVKRCVK